MYQADGNTKLARLLLRLALYADGFVFIMALCTATSGNSTGWSFFVVSLLLTVAALVYAYGQGALFEMLLERRFRAVCIGLGGNFMSQRKRLIANPLFALGGSLTREYTQTSVPKLREVKGNHESWTGVIIPFAGQD